MADKKLEARRKPALWTLGLAVTLALIWSVVSFPQTMRMVAPIAHGPDGDAGAFGAIAGSVLFHTIVVWTVMAAVFWRSSLARAAAYLAVIFVSVYLANVAAFEAVKTSAHRMDAADVAQDHTIADIVERFQGQVQTDHAAYLGELKALGFPDVIGPAFAQTDPHQRKALARLEDMRALVPKYRTLAASRIDGMVAAIKALPAGGPRDSFLAGFARSEAASRANLTQLWSLEDQILEAYEGSLRALARHDGHWSVRDGKYLFDDQAALADWRAHATQVEATVARQQVLITAGESLRAKMAGDLKQMHDAKPTP